MAEELPPNANPILPQLFINAYDTYDDEERALHRILRMKDYAGLLFFATIYGVIAFNSVEHRAIDIPDTPPLVTVGGCLALALAGYNWYLQTYVMTKAAKEVPDEYYVSTGPIGRFIWLTHQDITISFVHQLFSFFAPFFSRRLALATYAAALPVGGLGAFVTIQFFTLVRFHPDYIQVLRTWAKRGVHLNVIGDVVHLPQLTCSVLDLLLVKHRATFLELRPSFVGVVAVFAIYCLAYLVLLHGTYALTKSWPYSMLIALGKSPVRWAQFISVQVSILTLFTLSLLCLSMMLPATW
mmetsp:Transcript_461/g.1071  ORF Transcript_461/g.1071 Transcript_461/m.1071 type:complete len:297 (+) Transcript_461:65-955(+)